MIITPDVERLIQLALAEDIGPGDVTTAATVLPDTPGEVVFLAKAAGVVAGLPVAARVFAALDPQVELTTLVADGAAVTPGTQLALVRGRAASLLTGERLALNFVQHLSGIATRTAQFVALVQGTGARIVDTRKTVPGMRALAKYAVRCGGGANHRFALYDGVLIKDNHLRAAGGIAPAVQRARTRASHLLKVEVEVETLAQVLEALDAGADILLLDNMPLDRLREAVALCRGRALTEASGGVTEATVRAIAETGVDYISVGALTHSVTAMDISLDWT